MCPGAYFSPAPPCQGAFHRRHQHACVPRWPGLTASFIAANYWQQRCRRDGACKMGYHPLGFNDVRFCRLQWQPQLPMEVGGSAHRPPSSFPAHPSFAPHCWLLQTGWRGELCPTAVAWIRASEGDVHPRRPGDLPTRAGAEAPRSCRQPDHTRLPLNALRLHTGRRMSR